MRPRTSNLASGCSSHSCLLSWRETERAREHKAAGNALFSKGDLRGAHAEYSQSIKLAPPLLELRQVVRTECGTTTLAELRVAALANRAATALALGWYIQAILDASTAIAEANRFDGSEGQTSIGKLLAKCHARRRRAYAALGFHARSQADIPKSKRGETGQAVTLELDSPAAAASAGVRLRADWSSHGDWATTLEGFLGVGDLGRLRRLNRAWRDGVDANVTAWAAASVATLGSLAEFTAVASAREQAQWRCRVPFTFGQE
eukprot:SAG31_NODE_14826_length_785_cov_1.673469_1_plen_261_part_11